MAPHKAGSPFILALSLWPQTSHPCRFAASPPSLPAVAISGRGCSLAEDHGRVGSGLLGCAVPGGSEIRSNAFSVLCDLGHDIHTL